MSQSEGKDKREKREIISSFISTFYQRLKAFIHSLDLKLAIKMAVAAILSLYLSYGFNVFVQHPNYLLADLWCVITAVIVLQASIGGTYNAVWLRFIGVLIGSAIGAFFAYEFGASEAVIGLAIIATIIICSLLKIPDSYRLAALCVIVIMLPWKANPGSSPWVFAFFRFFDTCLGFLAAIIVSYTLWPSRALTNIRIHMAERFSLLSQFLDSLITKNLETSAIAQISRDKIETSFNHGELILEESKGELFWQSTALNIWISLIKCQQLIWENLSALQDVPYETREEIFDESLRQHIQYTLVVINLTFKEMASKLKNEQTHFDLHALVEQQESLSQELIRFRSTKRLHSYQLEAVEDCFVFFYQLRQILMNLQEFNRLLASFKEVKA